METVLLATGTVVPWQELVVSAETTGLAIVEVLREEGDYVEKGDLLAQLEDTRLEAQVEQQKAAIIEAQANLEAERAELRRAEQLFERNATSAQTVEQRVTAVRTAEARLAVAEAGLVQLNAQLQQAEIRAPAEGYISKRTAVLGQVVQTGTELFRIVRDGRLEVEAKVPETDLIAVEAGEAARVTGPAGRVFAAGVRAVAPTVDPRTRLGTVHITLPANTYLRPGNFARVEITTEAAPAVVVPRAAVVWREGGNAVFAVENGVAALRPVETGARKDGWIEITNGLVPGQRVAVDGASFLRDGERVAIDVAGAEQ